MDMEPKEQIHNPTPISHISINSQYGLYDNWPQPPSEEAYYGLAGDIVRTIEPHTEADPVAILVQLLAQFGNVIGKDPHFIVEADYHALKINPVLVGDTGKSRKGTALGYVTSLFNIVAPEWAKNCVVSGLSSGEGLIWAVHDPIETANPRDPGIADKRLLVIETEFASTLRRMGQKGNTLSPIIRQAWDSDRLRSLTKHSPAQATGAHVTVIGHITADELTRYLDRTEIASGFGNRFLWLCVKRSKVLPEGGGIQDINLQPLIDRLKDAVEFASSKVSGIKRDGKANELWHEIYPELSEGKPGMVGALIARSEAYTMRVACLYALLDCSDIIRLEHLKAGLAVWDYSEASVKHIFGDSLGDPTTDTIHEALRKIHPRTMSRTEISNLFQRHKSSTDITRALGLLHRIGKAESKIISTAGRSEERWIAIAK